MALFLLFFRLQFLTFFVYVRARSERFLKFYWDITGLRSNNRLSVNSQFHSVCKESTRVSQFSFLRQKIKSTTTSHQRSKNVSEKNLVKSLCAKTIVCKELKNQSISRHSKNLQCHSEMSDLATSLDTYSSKTDSSMYPEAQQWCPGRNFHKPQRDSPWDVSGEGLR